MTTDEKLESVVYLDIPPKKILGTFEVEINFKSKKEKPEISLPIDNMQD